MYFRSYFASLCLLAVSVAADNRYYAEEEHHFNLERHLINRARENSRKPHPDKIPNWMRGFYDDFTPEERLAHDHRVSSRHHRRHHERSRSPEYYLGSSMHHDNLHHHYSALSPSGAEDYERTHHERGLGRLPMSHDELIRHD